MTGLRLLLGAAISMGIFGAGEAMGGAEIFFGDLVKAVGPVAFLAWYCWYNETKVKPALHAEHRDEVRELAASLGRTIERIAVAVESRPCIAKDGTLLEREKGHTI